MSTEQRIIVAGAAVRAVPLSIGRLLTVTVQRRRRNADRTAGLHSPPVSLSHTTQVTLPPGVPIPAKICAPDSAVQLCRIAPGILYILTEITKGFVGFRQDFREATCLFSCCETWELTLNGDGSPFFLRR
jgi:hypothetical protein